MLCADSFRNKSSLQRRNQLLKTIVYICLLLYTEYALPKKEMNGIINDRLWTSQ